MAIATFLGLLFGLLFGDLCEVFAPYAAAYIMLLKVTAVPYLIGAIIHGLGQLNLSQAKLILKKGILFIFLAWFVNIAMIYATYSIFPKSKTSQMTGYIAGNIPTINFAELLIPDNIFYDLTNNIIPAIVIFSIAIGIALMHLKEKQILVQGFQYFVEALTRITGWIARITPLGTFIIIANQAGTIQFSTIKQVSSYLILYILCLTTITFWIFPRITSMLTKIPSYRWLQQMFPILLLAYTTNMVIICLPYIIELLKKETLTIDPYDEKAQTQIQGTVSVIFNLPMGSLFITVFILFISLFYNAPLSFPNHIELFLTTFLTSLGAVGIGSWINSLTFILDSLGLPQEATSLFLTTIPFTSGFQSMISATEITALSLFIILSSRKLIKFDFKRIFKSSIITVTPIIVLFSIVKAFNPLPEITNDKKSIFELSISSDITVTTPKSPPQPIHNKKGEDALKRILETKKLRVGYFPHVAPFSFYNFENSLTGYDIAFAYELAYDLDCDLELVPMTYANVIQELQSGLYDVAMSSLSINEERLRNLSFTDPYLNPEFVFITPPQNRKLFTSLLSIKSDPSLSIAVLKGTSYETIARELFPLHKIILIESPDQFASSSVADAFLWTEDEAIAWSLFHHQLRVVFPSPSIGRDSIAYATDSNNPLLLNYLNQWMRLKKIQGYTENQYNLWILEKTEMVVSVEPRWSLVRYLGFVK